MRNFSDWIVQFSKELKEEQLTVKAVDIVENNEAFDHIVAILEKVSTQKDEVLASQEKLEQEINLNY